MWYRVCAALAALSLLLASPAAVLAQTVSPGMQFTGTLNQSINSKNVQVDQPVTLVNVQSSDGSIGGATMYGHVASVQRAGQGRAADILIAFDTLQLANGTSYSISGQVTKLQAETKNNGAKEAAGTVAGMIVGNIFGKWVGTNVGGAVGAAGGYVIAKNNREDITIPANSQVTVELASPRQQQPSAPLPR
jgi:hypothetical protein